MNVFTGGSAYSMVRDIAEGYVIPTELTFKRFAPGDFVTFGQEADKLLRELRGNQVAATDVEAAQKRLRSIQRVQQAMTIARSVQSRRG
jgi:hypothetical protein